MDYWIPRAAALGFALAAGCISRSPAPVVEETTGELGHGAFRWDCLDDSDSACGTGTFPRMVALGSRFELSFTPEASVPDEIDVFSIEAVSPSRLGLETGQWVALRAGEVSVAVLADAYALDYVDLRIVPVDELLVGEHEPLDPGPCPDVDADEVCDGTGEVVTDAPVSLVVGEVTELRARALGEGSDLAGALPYEWESLTPELLEVRSSSGRSAWLSVLGKGTVRLRVRVGDYEEEFTYPVRDAAPEDTDTDGESESEGDTESSSESGSGSDTGSGSESGTTDDPSTGGDTEGATTTGGMQ